MNQSTTAKRVTPDEKDYTKTRKSIKDRLFQDNTARYVVGQPPNVPIILILIGLMGSRFLPPGSILAQIFSLIGFGAVFLWSYLEVRYGESLFRKILGLVVIIGVFVITLQ